SERSFDELLEEERAYVLRHLTDRNEYETMRGLLLHMRTSDREQEPLVAPDSVRSNVINAFRAQQRPKWQIWLNSVGPLLWPKEMSALWRPALAFASLAILITAGVVLVRNYGTNEVGLAELKDVEHAKAVDVQKELQAPNGIEGNAVLKPVTAEAADVAAKELQGAARVAQQQELANENGFLSKMEVSTGSTIIANDVAAMEEPMEVLAKRSESLKEINREKAGSFADVSKDDKLNEDAEYMDGARVQEMLADEADSIRPVFDATTAAPPAPTVSHVVTESELAVNHSRANVGTVQAAQEGKFKKSDGNAAQSRSLAVDAELVSLLNAGW
ncbi:MAG TPA: hypothetical protein PLX64_16420, partial [Flavobacteriales bacterium]|nr:hypothetical protein [Flavobacteriales bacterium]